MNFLGQQKARVALIAASLAVPVALFVSLASMSSGHERSIQAELSQMGMEMMLVPLGCPYDGAARVVKGQSLDNTLPHLALSQVRSDPDVDLAAPMLITAIPREGEKRVDMWVGLDESSRSLKPWWKAEAGADWFEGSNRVILGAEAALVEMRKPGDSLYSREAQRKLAVDGTLARSGTADDNLFFVPLQTAQSMFNQPGRLTAIAIRLRKPDKLSEVSRRMQAIPGAQVVTMTEVTGVFLNMVGSVRILIFSITTLAATICLMTILNTMLAAVLQRSNEIATMRAIGASRGQIFTLITMEASMISAAAFFGGIALAAIGGRPLTRSVSSYLPLTQTLESWSISSAVVTQAAGLTLLAGLAAGLYPAWRASRIHPAPLLSGSCLT